MVSIRPRISFIALDCARIWPWAAARESQGWQFGAAPLPAAPPSPQYVPPASPTLTRARRVGIEALHNAGPALPLLINLEQRPLLGRLRALLGSCQCIADDLQIGRERGAASEEAPCADSRARDRRWFSSPAACRSRSNCSSYASSRRLASLSRPRGLGPSRSFRCRRALELLRLRLQLASANWASSSVRTASAVGGMLARGAPGLTQQVAPTLCSGSGSPGQSSRSWLFLRSLARTWQAPGGGGHAPPADKLVERFAVGVTP